MGEVRQQGSMSWASVNGRITPAAEAVIPVVDRGFLFADSVYEVLRTVRHRPLFWSAHLERLHASARRIGMTFIDDVLRDEAQALTARLSIEARLRIVITRGVTMDGPCNRVLIATPLGVPASERFLSGCGLHCVAVPMPGTGPDPHAKTGDRKLAVAAGRAAELAGFHEALRVDPAGRVLEGATSTIFAVRDGVLMTPPLDVGVLAGITRAKVLAIAQAQGLPVTLRTFLQSELPELSELFITSTCRGVVPVNRVDDVRYVAPGPITTQIAAAYRGMLGA